MEKSKKFICLNDVYVLLSDDIPRKAEFYLKINEIYYNLKTGKKLFEELPKDIITTPDGDIMTKKHSYGILKKFIGEVHTTHVYSTLPIISDLPKYKIIKEKAYSTIEDVIEFETKYNNDVIKVLTKEIKRDKRKEKIQNRIDKRYSKKNIYEDKVKDTYKNFESNQDMSF